MKNSFFLVLCCVLSACASQREEFGNGQPALHAVQDQELRVLMDRMNGLMMERFMTEQEMDVERDRFARQIIDASKTLSSTATAIVDKLPGLGLDDNAQKAFRTLAKKLGQQAKDLQTESENRRYNAMSATLHEMSATCMACHTLFRKL